MRRCKLSLQVKVWLGEGMSHYYVLSRFLISRMLTVTKIPYMKAGPRTCVLAASKVRWLINTSVPHQAVKIALEVKKYLIDNDQFDVTQVSRYRRWHCAHHCSLLHKVL